MEYIRKQEMWTLHINWSKVVDFYYYWKRNFWYIGKRIKELLNGEEHADTVLYIGGSEVLPPPLDTEEEKECLRALSTENDEEALYHGIKRLLDDPALLAHYKKQAAERGKTFSTENTVKAVEEMLLKL